MLRTLLLELAKSFRLRRWITTNGATRRWSQRFVPGEEISLAIAAARICNRDGMTVSLDHLGENVFTREDAERACASYIDVLDRIASENIDSNVSLKLTHLGLDLGDEFCAEQLRKVTHRAAELRNFVRVDMEGSAYTDRTLCIVKQARAETDAVGTVIQSCLHRSEQDIPDLLGAGCRIRLVKGAYKEPSQLAFPHKKDVDANYIKLMKVMLPSGIYHALATHDPNMIAETIRFASEQGIAKDKFEFQMLYGIRTDLQSHLVQQGYRVRVYIPFGQDWFPYFMRRLAERPANLLFFAKNLFERTEDERQDESKMSRSQTMRAMVLEQAGKPLVLQECHIPEPAAGEVQIKVHACAVCRTDLHVVDGELPNPKLPLIIGHEIVGQVTRVGEGVTHHSVGDRVGVPWLGWTDGDCSYCRAGMENLCVRARFTGYTLDGGYAEFTVADARFCVPIPERYSDVEAAPLLCAGLIGYRSLVRAGDGKRLGIYGFGGAAHIITQVALFQGRSVYAFTRPGDQEAQQFARSLGRSLGWRIGSASAGGIGRSDHFRADRSPGSGRARRRS